MDAIPRTSRKVSLATFTRARRVNSATPPRRVMWNLRWKPSSQTLAEKAVTPRRIAGNLSTQPWGVALQKHLVLDVRRYDGKVDRVSRLRVDGRAIGQFGIPFRKAGDEYLAGAAPVGRRSPSPVTISFSPISRRTGPTGLCITTSLPGGSSRHRSRSASGTYPSLPAAEPRAKVPS